MNKHLMEILTKKKIKILGLMSGTSADGLDIACVEFDGDDKYPEYKILAKDYMPYPEKFSEAFKRPLELSTVDILKFDMELGRWYGEAISKLDMEFDLIASHGQTLLHDPPAYTLQIGEAQYIADQTGKPVVYDFRTADLVAGGQGAPLIPIVDDFLLRKDDEDIVALNLGGIANITYLPAIQSKGQVIAYDTGPANTLIDKAVYKFSKGKETYDRDGVYALKGKVNNKMLRDFMSHEYFGRDLPKSAGQVQFGYRYFDEILAKYQPQDDEEWYEFIRTLSEMTVQSIVHEIKKIRLHKPNKTRVLVSGGGALNFYIMTRLQNELKPMSLEKFEHLHIDSDIKEAFGFAYLAYLHLRDIPGNIACVTGSDYPVVLGKLVSPNCRRSS